MRFVDSASISFINLPMLSHICRVLISFLSRSISIIPLVGLGNSVGCFFRFSNVLLDKSSTVPTGPAEKKSQEVVDVE